MEKNDVIRPPSLSNGMDLRTWLAGCALANSKLISSELSPEDAGNRALAIADSVLCGLKTRIPSRTDAPTPEQLQKMDEKSEARQRPTMPIQKRHTPPPGSEAFKTAISELKLAVEENNTRKAPGFYSMTAK